MKSSSSRFASHFENTAAHHADGGASTNEILTAQEVAVELRCSKAQVYKLMNGEVKDRTPLPHIALGRKKVVRRSSFEAWKRANENGAILSDDSEMKAVGTVI